MENGDASIETKLARLTVSDANGSDGLFQVMKAVEAAEATIKQQVEENNRLRSELQRKIQELDKYKTGDPKSQVPHPVDRWDEHVTEHHIPGQVAGLGHQMDLTRNTGIISGSNKILQKNLLQNDVVRPMDAGPEDHFDSSRINGSLKVITDDHGAVDNSGFSQFVSPSTSFSPGRYQLDGDSELQLNASGKGLVSMVGIKNPNISKQELSVIVREHEEEISQLRKHLAEYSVKESQIRNEKYVLEKRIAYMRMAFDQQQQDLVDAASKAINYRQEIMEENVRLTYALQAAQQERSTFISSLMPLLAEYSLQPPVADAQSIVSNVKVLFRHFQEQLLVSEGKLKESQYQLAPWRTDVNPSIYAQSPSHPPGIKNGLELVAQPAYSNEKMLSSDPQMRTDGDFPQMGPGEAMNAEPHDLDRYPHLASRNAASQDVPTQHAVDQMDPHVRNNEEVVHKKVTFGDLVRRNEMDELDNKDYQNNRDSAVNWAPRTSAYSANLDDPNSSYSPYLPPVLEEPSSSFSEAADDDPLPAIEGLQISGEAFPGRQLQATGYSINGTTSCNFEWVRHLEDGSFNYIDGAKQPNYIVTADDVDTYLAIEVQPLDDRKRKGELVKVFANEHRKITCDMEMHNCIEKTLYSGHASYRLSLSTGYLDIWEPATLAVKRDGYSIKCIGPSGVVVSEKFSPSTIVSIPYGSPMEFSIIDSQRMERLLKVENSSDINSSRDTIVLTLRLFIIKAIERKKGKKRGLFFNK